jgi:hypothetical protein
MLEMVAPAMSAAVTLDGMCFSDWQLFVKSIMGS